MKAKSILLFVMLASGVFLSLLLTEKDPDAPLSTTPHAGDGSVSEATGRNSASPGFREVAQAMTDPRTPANRKSESAAVAEAQDPGNQITAATSSFSTEAMQLPAPSRPDQRLQPAAVPRTARSSDPNPPGIIIPQPQTQPQTHMPSGATVFSAVNAAAESRIDGTTSTQQSANTGDASRQTPAPLPEPAAPGNRLTTPSGVVDVEGTIVSPDGAVAELNLRVSENSTIGTPGPVDPAPNVRARPGINYEHELFRTKWGWEAYDKALGAAKATGEPLRP